MKKRPAIAAAPPAPDTAAAENAPCDFKFEGVCFDGKHIKLARTRLKQHRPEEYIRFLHM